MDWRRIDNKESHPAPSSLSMMRDVSKPPKKNDLAFLEIEPAAGTSGRRERGPPLIVSAMLIVGDAILLEAALAFLGLGDPNRMSWGYLIAIGRTAMLTQWWIVLFAGLAIFLTVLSLNLIGGGLTDSLNPRSTQGGHSTAPHRANA